MEDQTRMVRLREERGRGREREGEGRGRKRGREREANTNIFLEIAGTTSCQGGTALAFNVDTISPAQYSSSDIKNGLNCSGITLSLPSLSLSLSLPLPPSPPTHSCFIRSIDPFNHQVRRVQHELNLRAGRFA
jgi:hypothetical protein